MNKQNQGRKKGSKNKLSTSANNQMYNSLEPHLKDIGKNLKGLPFDQRITHIKHFSKILAVGNDEVAEKTRKLIYEGLEEHYKKIKFYFPHVPQEKKASELRQFLKLLPDEKINEVIIAISKEINKP